MRRKKDIENLCRSNMRAIVLVAVSLAIALLPMTARVAQGVDAIANWPDLKVLLHSQADTKVVTLSRSTNLILDARDAVLAPDLELLQVDDVTNPTVVVPANGVLTFAVGALLGVRFLDYFFFTAEGELHIQSVVLGAVLLLAGFQMFLTGIVADLIATNRSLMEETLTRVRKVELDLLSRGR